MPPQPRQAMRVARHYSVKRRMVVIRSKNYSGLRAGWATSVNCSTAGVTMEGKPG
jgi:hypothetical protein